jgi:hypothetical protein
VKHLLVAALALLMAVIGSPAHAAPGDACSFLTDSAEVARCRAAAAEPATGAMFARCADQMVRGLCDQLPDPFAGCAGTADPAACRAAIEAKVEPVHLADGRRVEIPRRAVFAVRGLQTAIPTDLTMCHAAAAFCRESPRSLECLVGLINWGRSRDWGK